MFSLLPSSLGLLLSSLLWNTPTSNSELHFQLRHSHAITNTSRIVLSDEPHTLMTETFSIDAIPVLTHRPPSFSAFSNARLRSSQRLESEALTWSPIQVQGPDVQNRKVLQLLANMTANAYALPAAGKRWYEIGSNWNGSYPYGWEPDADGFRGHVFVSTDESTVVISIKGTTVPWIGDGPTARKDKLNDNLLFSCCCARVGPTWSSVCGCYKGGHRCDMGCVERSLAEESLFYLTGVAKNIWLIGHSLGGALASLIGVTFGAPVVTFQAPGEAMAARRLHLPSPPSTHHVTHVINNADPIAMGVCNGVTSSCASAGYAMESRCHLGKTILYNTVERLGWSTSVTNHPIKVVIEKVLSDEGWEVPEAVEEDEDCEATECLAWKFVEGN
ncbi:putative lipase atg15 [Marasmius crinis-equi]|uniref:triacylglycerol lipase n=1 Tax=Marasmius crinis-equi TaxID=585013 RepID=A0ABR3F1C8_9AGAR